MTSTTEAIETIWATEGGGTPDQGGGSKGDGQKGFPPPGKDKDNVSCG